MAMIIIIIMAIIMIVIISLLMVKMDIIKQIVGLIHLVSTNSKYYGDHEITSGK